MLDDGREIIRSGVVRHKFLIKTFTNMALKIGKNSYQIPAFETLKKVNRYTKSVELCLGFAGCSPAAT